MDSEELKLVALVAVGGAFGSVLRYLIQGYATKGDFPWGTFLVNILGSSSSRSSSSTGPRAKTSPRKRGPSCS